MMDALILYGAITALFGALGAVARELYVERGRRLTTCEKENSYLRERVIPTILDSSEKQLRAQAVLTRVVEESLKRRPEQNA